MTAKTTHIYRQGDVMLLRVEGVKNKDGLTEVPRDARGVVLALGEATGHAHRLTESWVKLYARAEDMADQALRLLHVTKTAWLRHEEHAPIKLPRGTYRVVIQRQYQYGASRQVAD